MALVHTVSTEQKNQYFKQEWGRGWLADAKIILIF